jgi:protein phosphatase
MVITIDAEGLSDVGKLHEKNGDQFLIAQLGETMAVRSSTLALDTQTELPGGMVGYLFAVADGMGWHSDGEEASELATYSLVRYVHGMLPWFHSATARNEEDVATHLLRAFKRCESVVQSAFADDAKPTRMRSTLTIAYLDYPNLFVVNVGDSRCYVLRDTGLHQITVDQTVAQELLEHGVFDAEEAADTETRSMLSQEIGGARHGVQPDVYVQQVESDDTILLCTDGLTDCVSDQTIAEVLDTGQTADMKCRELVQRAKEAEGSDNTTVVVARILDEDDAAPVAA